MSIRYVQIILPTKFNYRQFSGKTADRYRDDNVPSQHHSPHIRRHKPHQRGDQARPKSTGPITSPTRDGVHDGDDVHETTDGAGHAAGSDRGR